MSIDLFQLIQEQYPQMTKSFQKTADFIVLMRERVLLYSAGTLAKHVGVSDATIIRFCQSLGYDGYSELKRALVTSLENASATVLGEIPPEIHRFGAQHEYIDIAVQYELSALGEVSQNLSVEKVCQTVDAIEKARKSFFLGLGSSAIPAHSLYFAFDRLQLNCVLLDFGGNALMEKLAFSNEKDVLVAASFPRYSTDTYNAIRQAKENGTATILISDGNSERLSALADVEFVVPSKNPFMMYNSNVSALMLCNILVLEYCYRHSEESSRILQSITEKTMAYKIK